jgi:hypothetical protein
MTDQPAARPPAGSLKASSLLIAALIVTPLASFTGSLIVSGSLVAVDDMGGARPVSDGILALVMITIIATLVSLLFVLAALLLLALPTTLALDRLGLAAQSRNLILLAIGAGAAFLLYPISRGSDPAQGWIFPAYALVSAVLWVLALYRMDRRAA